MNPAYNLIVGAPPVGAPHLAALDRRGRAGTRPAPTVAIAQGDAWVVAGL